MSHKYVYLFKEGNAGMRELLGGKGANLAEMTNLGLPIPQGFTVSTEACTKYYEDGEKISKEIEEEIFENLKKLEEILDNYQVDTIIIWIPINMDGTEGFRVEVTKKFIHKLKCKFNKIKIEEIDERLTTVAAHKTMNLLDVNKYKKKNIVDTISAVYILETYFSVKLCTFVGK